MIITYQSYMVWFSVMTRKRKRCNDGDELISEWLIAGERVKLTKLAPRKLRRLNTEQLRILAYKQRLIELGREGDLLKTLAVFEEIQTLGLQVDLVLIQMVLSTCSGMCVRDSSDGKAISNGTQQSKYAKEAAEVAVRIYKEVSCFALAHLHFHINQRKTTIQVCEKAARFIFRGPVHLCHSFTLLRWPYR